MKLPFWHGALLVLALGPWMVAQEGETRARDSREEIYWRLRAAQIDARYDAEISQLKAKLARLLSRRFDLPPDHFKGAEVKIPSGGGGLPPEVLSLQKRITELDKERSEAHRQLEIEGRRAGALPGWFRPAPPGSDIWEEVTQAQAEETIRAERETEAQREKERRAPRDEEYWRKRFAQVRSRISTLEAEQARLRKELNQAWLGRMEATPSAVYGSHLYYLPMIAELQNRLRKNQEELQKARQALEDAQIELRQSGGSPGWARE